MEEINHRFFETNGIKMHIAEQGKGETIYLCVLGVSVVVDKMSSYS